MTIATAMRRRIEALNRALNPAGSFRARLAALTDEQRATYHRWRAARSEFHARHPNGESYALMLDNSDSVPGLREDVRDALFGPPVGIPIDSTTEQAAAIYSTHLEKRR